jgi:hypothetical protein
MYLPRWSNEILDELRRTLLEKLGRSPQQVDHLLNELNRHFADARVEGFETLVALMTNDPGDRHVIAADVKCGAEAGNYSAAEETAAVFPAVHRGSDNAGSRDYFKGKAEKLYGAKVTCW